MNTKERITELLLSTQRDGMDAMIEYLNTSGFFESPASTKFHGAYPGGLADHSLAVYVKLNYYALSLKLDADTTAGKKPLKIEEGTCIIAPLLHDICKAGAYVRTKADDGWTNNKSKDKGHAKLSIQRIKKCIKLTQLEEMMIRFHMGLYGANEFEQYCGEYSLCGDHSNDKEKRTREEKEASKTARYGKSLRNAWFHNPICKVFYFCDELATLEEKAKRD